MVAKAVEVVLFFASLVIAGFIGANLIPGVMEDIRYNFYRTSAHSVALDIAGLTSLTVASTGDIIIDYKIDNEVQYGISAEGQLLQIVNLDDTRQKFIFSLPFSIRKAGEQLDQIGTEFRISKIDDSYTIAARK